MANVQNTITAWSIFSLLIGTVISSIVAYVLQRRSFAEARLQKAADKLEARKAIGLTLFHKLIRISSTLDIISNGMRASEVQALKDGIKGEPWQIHRPFAALPSPVSFSPEERTFLMLLDHGLFSNLGAFDDIHNTHLKIFEEYKVRRTMLTDSLSAKMSSGGLGRSDLTPEEMGRIAPKAAELNLMLGDMKVTLKRDAEEATQLLDRLRRRLNEEFKLSIRLEPSPNRTA